jgi:hypothetical protein
VIKVRLKVDQQLQQGATVFAVADAGLRQCLLNGFRAR